MAGGARQFIVKFATDLAGFVTDRAARGLEDVGDAAHRTGEQLENIGDSAHDAARRIDDSFDRIRQASRQTGDSFRRMDDDSRSAMGNIKEEAGETAREMGSSFSGSVDDVSDAFQELAANAGAALGPVGLAAGIALAVGLGAARAKAEEVTEEINDIYSAMKQIQTGASSVEAAMLDYFDSLDAKQMVAFQKEAEKLGLTMEDLARARLGDEDALRRVTKAQDDYGDSVTGIGGDLGEAIESFREWGDEISKGSVIVETLGKANDWLREKMGLGVDTTKEAAEAAQAYTSSTEALREAVDAQAAAEEGVAAVTQDAAQKVIEAHTDSSGTIQYTADMAIEAMRKQAEAAERYADNIGRAFTYGMTPEVLAAGEETFGVSGFQQILDDGLSGGEDRAREFVRNLSDLTKRTNVAENTAGEMGRVNAVLDRAIGEQQAKFARTNLKLNVTAETSTAEFILARLAAPRTAVITAKVVGNTTQYTQGTRRLY